MKSIVAKVKVFSSKGHIKLEKDINHFLESIKINNLIDIKYSKNNQKHTAMILYKGLAPSKNPCGK